jgi:hypothetical protein
MLRKKKSTAVLNKVRYALCPMPYALCPLIKRAPHVTEKGYTSQNSQMSVCNRLIDVKGTKKAFRC